MRETIVLLILLTIWIAATLHAIATRTYTTFLVATFWFVTGLVLVATD